MSQCAAQLTQIHWQRGADLMTLNDLKEYATFNREFLDMVREGKKAGKSAEEIIAAWQMPAKYSGYTAPQPARLKSNVEVILAELK